MMVSTLTCKYLPSIGILKLFLKKNPSIQTQQKGNLFKRDIYINISSIRYLYVYKE